jgi:ABC-type multidrug transport system fused ATPase/permease subunit
MLRIDVRLALAFPLFLPVFYLALRTLRGPMRRIAQALQEAEANVIAAARQNLEMLPMIKAFAREDTTAGQFRTLIDRAMKLAWQEATIYSFVGPFMGFVAASAAVILLVVTGRGVEAGTMTAAEMLSFLFYAALLTRPAAALAGLYGKVQRAQGALARMQRVMKETHEAGYSATRRVESCRGEIRFAGVHFAYVGRSEVLKNANLHIQAGETVAIAGHNGAGKSTMIALLLRFYEPDSGAILIDGENIAAFDLQDLRRQIGFVSQEVILFNGTIGDNIGYGREGASAAEIAAAAKAARADDFINALPLGLGTQIGDAGVFLSGGQRQRVALARALLKDPPIIVLDEANSMYDLEGEAAFVEACAEALKDRTAILITHREATLALADRIVRLDKGVISEGR